MRLSKQEDLSFCFYFLILMWRQSIKTNKQKSQQESRAVKPSQAINGAVFFPMQSVWPRYINTIHIVYINMGGVIQNVPRAAMPIPGSQSINSHQKRPILQTEACASTCPWIITASVFNVSITASSGELRVSDAALSSWEDEKKAAQTPRYR